MIKGVSMGLGVVPADLDELSLLDINKVRQLIRHGSRVAYMSICIPQFIVGMQPLISAAPARKRTASNREKTTVQPDEDYRRRSSALQKSHEAPMPQCLYVQTDTFQLVFSTQLLFVVVVFSSKIAACLLIHRLTPHKTQRIYALAIITASVVFCLVSLMTLSIGVGDHKPWIHQQNGADVLVSVIEVIPKR
jgi:hypothetical protein